LILRVAFHIHLAGILPTQFMFKLPVSEVIGADTPDTRFHGF